MGGLVYTGEHLAASSRYSEGGEYLSALSKKNHKKGNRSHSGQHILPSVTAVGGSQQAALKHQLHSALRKPAGTLGQAGGMQLPSSKILRLQSPTIGTRTPSVHPRCCSVHLLHSNKS